MNACTIPRRRFVQRAFAAGVLFPFVARRSWAVAPNDRIGHVSFGAGGMAGADLGSIAGHPNVDVVAAAEIDANTAAAFQKKFPKAKVYADWRELLRTEARNFDTANVSTPDHMHAPIAMSAMRLGKHVYVQKPLTHEVFESRRLREYASSRGLVTQMGIQVHSDGAYRTAVARVQSGAIGKVKSVHTWSSKKWGDTNPRPERVDALPANLNWDHWCGVVEKVPYLGGGYYHPGNWRKRLAFGTGTFGDMGCHIYDPVYKALALTAPLSLESQGPAPRGHNWAINARIRYVFPATEFTVAPTVEVTWYDGDQRPPQAIAALLEGDALPDQGSILIGTEGVMLIPHVSGPRLYPKNKFAGAKFDAVPGANHWHQFIDAVRGKGRTSAGFDYSGPLTEAVLLGGIATHFPNVPLQWDAAKLAFSNSKEATALVRREYRKGWEVAGL